LIHSNSNVSCSRMS